MAVYLYNLGFTLANAGNGNFLASSPGQTGLGQSDTWFQYNGAGLPPGVSDNLVALAALNPGDWTKLSAVPDLSSGNDYMVVRIFNTDSFPAPAPTFLLRLTAVMGHGSSTDSVATTPLQAPFQVGAKARPVIDTDNSTNPPTWPAPTGTDGAWSYCFGMIHGVANDYTCNIGATAYLSSGQYQGFSGFGHDPQLHVVTSLPAGDVFDKSAA